MTTQNRQVLMKTQVKPGKPAFRAAKTRGYPRRTWALMPDATIGTCANCDKDNRVLKYARRTMCWSYACQRAAHAEVQARKASRAGGTAKKEKAAPVFCHKIIEVYGQRHADPATLVGAKRRNKIQSSDMNESYLVLGEFVRARRMLASMTCAGWSSPTCSICQAAR